MKQTDTMPPVSVVGAGLAGCEAAWTLANAGVPVSLYEMKPQQYTPAHHYQGFAELICSNSLKAARIGSAAGMLKEEMRILGSLTMEAAAHTDVSAGGALAVDRERFSDYITEKILAHPLIQVIHQRVDEIPQGKTIIASGPLTESHLAESIQRLCGAQYLSFFDAAAPIVTFESLDQEKVFFAARYGRGEDDYINCPMDKEQYERFYQALVTAESVELHEFEKKDFQVYEGCMPVEVMAKRGADTLRYGPLKPVGLTDPRTGHRPWAVVQLRSENREGTLYNLVGFQTNLKFPEQKRVFSLIPGLEHAEFVRYGVMHRNTFLNSPKLLTSAFHLRANPRHLLCRADDRCGGICGVGGLRYSGGKKSGARPAGQSAAAVARRLHAGGAEPLHQRRKYRRLSADGRQHGNFAAVARACSGQDGSL